MLRLPKFEHIEIRTMKDLFAALDEHDGHAKVIAGGTDLIPRIKHRVIQPNYVLNLKGMSTELNFIRSNGNKEVRIGALTSLAEIENSPVINRDYPLLLQAVRSIGSSQIRNMGTIGGNVCLETRCYYYNQSHQFQYMEPCYKRGGTLCYLAKGGKQCLAVYMADTAPALISMGAKAVIRSKDDERVINLEDIYSGCSELPFTIRTNEIVTEIVLPPCAGSKGLYLKRTFRGALEFAVASLAVAMSLGSDHSIKDPRVVLGSVSSKPIRATKTEDILKGKKITSSVLKRVSEALAQEATVYPHHGNSAHCIKAVSLDLLRSAVSALGRS